MSLFIATANAGIYCFDTDFSLALDNLEIGITYVLLVDGCQGSVCNVGIDVTFTDWSFEIPDIAFDFDEHTLRPDYIPVLDSLVQTIAEIKPFQIAIKGHTDSRGSEAYNIILSEKRATTIKVFILNQLKDFRHPIQIEGLGESQPKATNATALGRAKNRRVEIVLSLSE